jgi:hypothetical protein
MAAITHAGSLKSHFRSLPDPRVVGRTRHLLLDIVVIAICAVIANEKKDAARFLLTDKRPTAGKGDMVTL